MTERFKQAVKDCVADAVLTDAEKELLMKIAKEEGCNETDAEIYIIKELKIAQINEKYADKNSTEKDNKSKEKFDWKVLQPFGEAVVAIAGIVSLVLTNRQNKKRNSRLYSCNRKAPNLLCKLVFLRIANQCSN